MPVSEKQKESARKWDKENMRSIACRLRTNDADAFKDYCTAHGTTPAALMKQHIFDCLEEWYKEMEKKEGTIE